MKKKKVKETTPQQDPALKLAIKAHEELAANLLAAEARGETELEFFDGSVFQLIGDTWHINTSFEFYAERWASRSDAQAVLSKSWDVLAEARTVVDYTSPYLIRAVLSLRLYPSFGFQAWVNARNLHGYFSGEENMRPNTHPVGESLGCNCAFVTSSGVMGFDPHVFNGTDPKRASSIIVHEALHIQRDHTSEMLVDSAKTNNILHDLEINDDIKAMGFEMMENFWLPESLGAPDFLHALDYLQYLPKPPPQKVEGEDGEGGDSSNKNRKGKSGAGKKPNLAVGPQAPSCGSGAGGEPLEAEGKVPGELKKSELELEASRMATAKDICNYSNGTNKTAGDVPANMLRWAEEKLKPPTLNWRRVLPSAVRNLCTRSRGWDRTDSKLSRTTINTLALADDITAHVIRCATYRSKPKILVALDTSGSMAGPLLDSSLSEIKGAIACDKGEIYFISFDCATYQPPAKVDFDIREIKTKVVGGGGTNVMVVYDDPAVKRMRFDAVVVITDGETPIAAKCPLPGVKSLFVVINGVDPFSMNGTPPWPGSKVIHIKD